MQLSFYFPSSCVLYYDGEQRIDDSLEAQLYRISPSTIDRLYDFVETKTIEPVRMAKRIAEVQDKISEMRKTRFEIEEDIRRSRLEPLDLKVVVEYVNDLKKFLESSNIFKRRVFLSTFIESLEVDDREITFDYGLPPDGAR